MRPATLFRLALAAVLALTVTGTAAEPPDRVEALRAVLARPLPVDASQEEIDKAVGAREKQVGQLVVSLRGPAELGRALLLSEWQTAPTPDGARNPTAWMDNALRNEVARRFRKEMETLLKSDNEARREAAAVLAGELAAVVRQPGVDNAYARQQFAALAPALAELAGSKGPAAVAAALALGRLDDPETIAPALRRLLSAADLDARRAAARALNELARLPAPLMSESLPERAHFLKTAELIVPAVAAGVANADDQARRLCLEGTREVARSLLRLASRPVRDPYHYSSQAERVEVFRRFRVEQAREAEALSEAALAIRPSVPALARALGDADPRAALAAAEALEALGSVRLSLFSRPDEDERQADAKPGWFADGLGDDLRDSVPALAKALSDSKEVRVKLACLYALEALRELAAPAAPEVVAALKDPNAYVRWGAVRVLGRLAPAEAERAVPALAPLLKDDNEYVRATTALVLARYGPKAKPAVKALAAATGPGDAGLRVLAIRALEAAGAEAAPAAADLGKALEADEAEVRHAAALALRRLGPLAAPASAALRRALSDSDERVRLVAAEALLGLK
jgi:HEAT repeat protein